MKDQLQFGQRIPMKWGKDVTKEEYMSVGTPFIYKINRLATGCWRLIYWNDDRKEIGVYPTLKEAKEAAVKYLPEAI